MQYVQIQECIFGNRASIKIHNYLLYYKEKSQEQAFALSKKLFFCQLPKALYEIGLVAVGRLG